MSEREMVEQFHRAMDISVRERPTMPSEEERLMRARLIHEEAGEVIRALGCRTFSDAGGIVHVVIDHAARPDLAHLSHELSDLEYVTKGGQVEAGIPPEVFSEVHAANMTKFGDDGRPVRRADGKVIKGPNYRPPDVARVLREHEK